MTPPVTPKIYHIMHIDRLPSVIADGFLWCDEEIERRTANNPDMGTRIGMNDIKKRRLTELTLTSHPDLYVGQCVPFYFCSRSVMLYVIHRANHRHLTYRGGQEPIVHLEADLHRSVDWADENRRRWAFTPSNAGAYHFEDYSDLDDLHRIDWNAVQETANWPAMMESKQAEFLMEHSFPWELVARIGVSSERVFRQARAALRQTEHRPDLAIRPEWYY